MKLTPFFIIFSIITLVVGCSGVTEQPTGSRTDLADARRGFTTQLKRRGPAPQDFEEAAPPLGVKEVHYTSGELKLKAWLSDDPGDGKKRPAVVYLHGGWSFGAGCWQDAAPFVDAGCVLMMPMLRAENGNPGIYEGFYGEVDDAIAAGRFVSELPFVDEANVFVAGHSVGAVLVGLTAMMPSNYRAAAALSGYMDIEGWINGFPEAIVFDTTNAEELRLRNPMAFPASLRIPLILYAERNSWSEGNNTVFQARLERAGKRCDLIITEGDHLSMVAPSVQHAIKWFRNHVKNRHDTIAR